LAAHRRRFIIVASLAILHAVQRGRTRRYPWTLLVAFSALSVAFNVLHAPPTAIARLVAAVPPLTLVLSFELLMRQLGDRTLPAADTASRLEATEAVAKGTTGGQSLPERARRVLESHRREGVQLTGKTLGQILGISDGYARRLLREIAASETASPTTESLACRDVLFPSALAVLERRVE
jgi:hypothetical protein